MLKLIVLNLMENPYSDLKIFSSVTSESELFCSVDQQVAWAWLEIDTFGPKLPLLDIKLGLKMNYYKYSNI